MSVVCSHLPHALVDAVLVPYLDPEPAARLVLSAADKFPATLGAFRLRLGALDDLEEFQLYGSAPQFAPPGFWETTAMMAAAGPAAQATLQYVRFTGEMPKGGDRAEGFYGALGRDDVALAQSLGPAGPHAAEFAALFNALKCARELGGDWKYLPSCVRTAAGAGHLEMVQLLVELRGVSPMADAIAAAARVNERRIITYLRSKDCPWNSRATEAAAEGGHLELLQWLRAQECPWDSYAACGAAKAGSIAMLEWIQKQPRVWEFGASVATAAASCGHTHVLQQYRKLIDGPAACRAAAVGGHLKTLMWLVSHGYKWNDNTPIEAVGAGHLDVVQWLHSQKCPMDERVTLRAAQEDRVQVLAWLVDQGVDWDRARCLRIAEEEGCEKVEAWINARAE